MKSVTLKDEHGEILIKVLHKKDGTYDILRRNDLAHLKLDIRDDSGCKVFLHNPRQVNLKAEVLA